VKIVIQCAASKVSKSGHFRMADGLGIRFVAHPDGAPADERFQFARPDDRVGDGSKTWRDLVANYNDVREGNPFRLFPAYRLYSKPVYQELV
jgi:hypothetical protein